MTIVGRLASVPVLASGVAAHARREFVATVDDFRCLTATAGTKGAREASRCK